ncbi:MAG: hypothetical protein HW421_938 [Ignavibacteria bacterium]|nr:hypothetical protein [Ignavibacteria bacterium]
MLISKIDLSSRRIQGIIGISILISATCLAWHPVIGIPFLNDDFQILGWHNPQSFLDCFKNFFNNDVTVYYWRPIQNIFHALTKYLFGMNPVAYRIENLIIYIISVLLVRKLIFSFSKNELTASMTALIFALLPAHELAVGWIASRGDVLAALFLLIAVLFYNYGISGRKKLYYYLSLLSFILAALSKESATLGILLPFVLIKFDSNSVKSLKNATRAFLIATSILFFLFLLRYLFFEWDLFNSPNIKNVNPSTYLFNYFAIIPVSILSAEQIEYLLILSYKSTFMLIVLCTLALCFTAFLFYVYRELQKEEKLIAQFGLVWFLLFNIPASLMLMRWYTFISSVGLVIFFGVIFSYLFKIEKFPIAKPALIMLLFYFAVINNSQMLKWQSVGKTVNSALQSFKQFDLFKYKKIVLWGVPDKIERINAMKIGVQQAVEFSIGGRKLEVESPLRIETSANCKINIEQKANGEFLLTSENARFLPIGEKTKAFITNENLSYGNNDYHLNITTTVINNIPRTQAEIILFTKDTTILNLYFDGKKFVKM